MKKKVLALFLAVVMIVTALPFNAFALSYGTQAELDEGTRKVGLTMCGFSTYSMAHKVDLDGDGVNDAMTPELTRKEVEAVINAGYVNQIYMPTDGNLETLVALCVEKDVDFWISPGRYYSDRITLESYVNNVEYTVNRIRAAGGYDNFLGFSWDEPIWGGQSSEDLYVSTKALYEKWGKRNFIVETPQVFVKGWSNSAGVQAITDEALTYITDVAWDNYSYDVRKEAQLKVDKGDDAGAAAYTAQYKKLYTNITSVDRNYISVDANYWDNYVLECKAQQKEPDYDGDGEITGRDYYKFYSDNMIERFKDFGRDVYVWYFPNANPSRGQHTGTVDENFVDAHIKYFSELLMSNPTEYSYAKAGGLSPFTYGDMCNLLPIQVEYDGVLGQLKTTNNPTGSAEGLWTVVAETLSDLSKTYNDSSLAPLSTNAELFGSLDVSNTTSNSISYNAVAGYEYTITLKNTAVADDATWETDGIFDGLIPETDYTVTVKRTADGLTKAFDVSTMAVYPYASGKNDTASYILKMPTSLSHINTNYGWPSTTLSQAEDSVSGNTIWHKGSNGKRIDGGFIPIVDVEGEKFLEFKLDSSLYEYTDEEGNVTDTQDFTNSDGNTSVSLSLGDPNRSSKDKGLHSSICADTTTSNLKYFAYRIRVDAGAPGQVSKFDFYLAISGQDRTEHASSFDLMFLDNDTKKLSKIDFKSGITLYEQEYDGWLIIPFNSYNDIDGSKETSNLDNIVESMSGYQLFMHHHTDPEVYCSHIGGTESNWDNRTLKVGDVMVLEDVGAFVETKQSANASTENERNVLTVPVDAPITFNPSDYVRGYRTHGDVYGYFCGITRYNNPNFMTRSDSQTIGGEQFFSYYVKEGTYNYQDKVNSDGTKSYASRWYTLFTPANYTLGVNFGATADNIASYPSLGGGGVLYGEQTISKLYSDAADFNYVAFRFKAIGGKDGETSPMGIHIGTGNAPINLTGSVIINYNDCTTTTIESGTTLNVPSNFDGWIVVPNASIATATRTGFVFLKDDEYTWYGKTLYHGDIKIVKNLDTFKKAHGVPEFTLSATNTTVTMETDSENASFSLDQLNWKTAADMKAYLAAMEVVKGTKYTVYAKYDGAVYAATSQKSVWAIEDTAKDILTVPAPGGDGFICYNNAGWDKPQGTGYYWGLTRWSTSDLKDPDEDGVFDVGAKFNSQNSYDIDGEYLFRADVYTDGTYQQNFLPATYMLGVNFDATAENIATHPSLGGDGTLYGSQPLSMLYDDVANYNYIAVRQKIVSDTETTINYHVGVSVASEAMCNFNNVVIVNYTDGTQTTITSSAQSYKLPANFDGWIIIPKANIYGAIAMADVKVVGIRYSNLVAGEKVYTGDIKIIEDLDCFVQVHYTPDYEVTANGASLTVSSTSRASENIVYSLDKATWLTETEFNAQYGVDKALAYDSKHTVYAKYESAPAECIVAQTVWTAPYGTHKGDGGSYYLNVYDDVEAHPFVANNSSLSPSGLSETGGAGTALFKDANGAYTNSSTTGRLNIVEINGETFIEFDRNEDVNLANCTNTTLSIKNITYGGAVDAGIHSSIDATNLTHFAVRLKIDELQGAENTTSGFYLYLWHNLGENKESNAQKLKTAGTYTIDINGNVTPYTASESNIWFTGEFDGWVVIPFSAYDVTIDGVGYTGKELITEHSTALHPYLHGENCHWQTYDGWDNKILYFGDVILLEGTDKFNMAHTKPEFELDADNTSITITDEYEDGEVLYTVDEKNWLTKSEFNSAKKRKSFVENTVTAVFANAQDLSMRTSKNIWTLTDSATNILEVPEAGTRIGVDDWYYRNDTLRYSTVALMRNSTNTGFASGDLIGYLFSETIDGENYFKVDFSNEALESATTTKYYNLNFVPINYYNGSNVTGYLDSAGSASKYYDRTMFSEYYSGTEDANYMAFRLRMTGGDENDASQLSKMSISLRAATVVDETVRKLAGATDVSQKGAVVINYTDNTITEITTATEYIELPSNFNGWILVTENSVNGGDGTFSSAAVPCFYFAHNATTSMNWRDRNLYVGDMMLVEDLDSFKRVYYHPEFEVKAMANMLAVTNETDTLKSALYSVDGENWLDIDAFRKVKRDLFTEYTVYAKYPNAQAKNIVSKTTWVTDESYELLDVPEDEQEIAHNKSIKDAASRGDSTYISKWDSHLFMKPNITGDITVDNNGVDTTTGDGNYQPYGWGDVIHVRKVDGESMFVINPEEVVSSKTGKIEEANGGMSFNNLSSIDDPSRFGVSGVPSEYSINGVEYVALRFKVSGGEAEQFSSFSIYLGEGKGWVKTGGSKLLNKATGEITDSGWGDIQMNTTGVFDGWALIPVANWNLAAMGTSFSLWMHTESCGSNHGSVTKSDWSNKVLYLGDISMVKNLDDFKKTIIPPEVTAELNEEHTNLVVTNEADTDKRALYTIDGVNWYDIDYINAVILEDDYLHELQAKYPWSDKIYVEDLETKVYVPPFGSGLKDDARYYLNVYDDAEAHPFLSYSNGLVGWYNKTMFRNKNTGEYESNSSAGFFVREVDGETFIEIDKRDYGDDGVTLVGDGNFSIQHDKITYNETVYGVHSSIDKTNLTHMAVRVNIKDQAELENVTSTFSIYASFDYTCENGNVHSYQIPEADLENAYLVTIDGTKIDPNWDGAGFKFTDEFNGWIVFPFDAYHSTRQNTVTVDGVKRDCCKPSFTGKELWLDTISSIQMWLHDTGCGHGQGTSRWLNRVLYLGDMLVLEDDDLFFEKRFCDKGIHNLEDVAAAGATITTNANIAHKRCTYCGACFDAETGETELDSIVDLENGGFAPVTFRAASLTLDNSTAVNFKANIAALTGYTNLRAEFKIDGLDKIYTVSEYTTDNNKTVDDASDDMYVFTFDDVYAEMMGNDITATLYATDAQGTEHNSSLTYSVKQYCYNKLAKYADDDSAKATAFKTLIVDLLYYGSSVQTYTGYKTDKLVKSDLTRAEKKLASVVIPEMEGIRAIYNNVGDDVQKSSWVSGNLSFQNNVQLKFRFKIDEGEDLSGYKLVVSNDLEGTDVIGEITNSEFIEGATDYTAYFDKFDATDMHRNLYVSVYNGSTKVSDTLAYSISAYARQKFMPKDPTNALSNVVLRMMKYGDSAIAFAPYNV